MERSRSTYAGVFVRGPEGCTVLVLDETRRNPTRKFPGGGGEYLAIAGRMETPAETARRELYEETGLVAKDLILLMVVDKGTHFWYLYETWLDNFDGLLKKGNEEEIVEIFHESKILGMPDFLPQHKRVIEDLVHSRRVTLANPRIMV